MKLFTTQQIREWDKYTIDNEPIASTDLMERAAIAFVTWFTHHFEKSSKIITVVCGTGNNGGDGLAIARLLRNRFYTTDVIICGNPQSLSPDSKINLNRLIQLGDIPVQYVEAPEFPSISNQSEIIIDALFGSGISRPPEGWYAEIIRFINQSENVKIISVDLPSGMPAEGLVRGECIKAHYTCSFQVPKLSFFRAENAVFIGTCSIVDIGLSLNYSKTTETPYSLIDKEWVLQRLKKRNTFDHKGTYGHSIIIAGSKGKAGAAILCAKAALRTGSGLVTAYIPEFALSAMNSFVPEVMTLISGKEHIVAMDTSHLKVSAVAAGPGLGTMPETVHALEALLITRKQYLVLDADALNIIASHKRMLKLLKADTIITPHPGEFDRLFGESPDSEHRFNLQISKSKELGLIIVLKGAHTTVTCPDGKVYINSTGNPGMATAGSGDVLTGIIVSLLGQGYAPRDAAVIGVYLHGLAGDLSLNSQSMESMIASDIIENLGKAFRHIHTDEA